MKSAEVVSKEQIKGSRLKAAGKNVALSQESAQGLLQTGRHKQTKLTLPQLQTPKRAMESHSVLALQRV
jgi:hypothetical protein